MSAASEPYAVEVEPSATVALVARIVSTVGEVRLAVLVFEASDWVM